MIHGVPPTPPRDDDGPVPADVLLDAIVTSQNVGYLVMSADGRIRQASANAAELFGAELPLERPLEEALAAISPHDGDLARGLAWYATDAASERPPPRVMPVGPAGQTRWLHLQMQPWGELRIVSVRDVTEEFVARESLMASEQRYRVLVDGLQVGVFRVGGVDADEFTAVNPAMAELLGYASPEALLGRKGSDHFADRGAFSRTLAMLARDGEVHGLAMEVRRSDDSTTWAEFNMRAELDARGRLRSISGSAADITDRTRAEAALRASEQRYRTLFETARIGLAMVRADGRIVRVNDAFARMFGYPPTRLATMTSRDLTHPDDQERSEAHSAELRAGLRPLVEMEKRYLRADGSVMWAHTTVATPGSDPRGESVVMVLDITERRRLEEELQRVEKLESLGVLAGGLAHDFNNILTGIVGNISLARISLDDDDPLRGRLAAAEQATLRARALTQQLLTFSRGGAPVRRLASIAALLRDASGFAMAGSNTSCRLEMPDDLWAAEIDEGQIGQVVDNLLINADQAMPEGGVITIRAWNQQLDDGEHPTLAGGEYVGFAVEDAGVGIAARHRARVFDPFFTTKTRGSGLGLSSAHSIITRHGGHIGLDSALERGTTITVLLPASRRRPAHGRGDCAAPPPGQGRLLLMDDDPHVGAVAAAALEHAGYEVRLVSDGALALEAYEQARRDGRTFAAVLLDLTVPGGMGGLTTMEQLRAIDPDVRGIVCSGYSTDPVMADHAAHGFRGVLPKPYSAEQLCRVVAAVLEGDRG